MQLDLWVGIPNPFYVMLLQRILFTLFPIFKSFLVYTLFSSPIFLFLSYDHGECMTIGAKGAKK